MVVQVSLNGLKRCTKILYVNIIETFCYSCCSCQHGMDYMCSCVTLSCLMALPSIAPEICGFAYRRCTI
ncbi:hypothetical protein T08_14659 [Trichinella sp. T8]|nr:hypothetical protein T08_14659 [Trichinella sp. T8]